MLKVLFKYYCDVNFFNLIYTLLVGVLFLKFYYVPIVFASFGTFLGVLSYQYFYSNQYYFYYNLGLTKRRLNTFVFILNFLVSLLIFIIFICFK
ncbi:hypothetical protein SAMN06265346_1335 [Flavobacterium hercynium]|uniref:Uncharacterized protein n=1 Tax=Flavobacterium hercynium TaxID=387094 RepID=A0A226HM85_9FLAO|nr:hypothetical protein B0A66_02830 [Flavobacterium hercynium]SMP37448.1 hypothetical protein SAMN06265346_1335 [Flavobacterium hercynium]